MAFRLADAASGERGALLVPNDQPKDKPASAYVIESIEYVRTKPLPHNALFDDLDELEQMLAYTKESIEARRQSMSEPPESA